LAGDIQRTRQWWDEERQDYECFISAVVIDELEAGSYPWQQDCLRLVASLPFVEMAEEVLEIAAVYQRPGLMPKPPVRDALHLALASFYRMDCLLPWKCHHLANANKVRHLEVLNQSMGLSVPLLVTPHMLYPGEFDHGR
jgi:hypothetical protein